MVPPSTPSDNDTDTNSNQTAGPSQIHGPKTLGTSPPLISWIVEPNYGREPSKSGPINTEHFYQDPDVTLPVRLLSYRKSRGIAQILPVPHRHWSLSWVIEEGLLHRVLNIVIEHGSEHFTFWGAITTPVGFLTQDPDVCVTTEIGRLTLAERHRLEQLALQVTVWKPNGHWNCQSWLRDLFSLAIDAELFTQANVDAAIDRANVY